MSNLYTVNNITNQASVINTANNLHTSQQEFEARTNNELYKLLGGIYSLYLKAEKAECLSESVDEMKEKMKDLKLKVQKNSSDLTIFTRFIFRTDRKKSYKYSKTLELVKHNEISPSNMVNFIKDSGGIESCKDEMVKINNEKSGVKDAFSAKFNKLFNMKTNATVLFNKFFTTDEEVNDDKLMLVLAKASTDGSVELLKVVPDEKDTMLNSAIRKIKVDIDDTSSLNPVVKAEVTGKEQSVKEKALNEAIA